VRSNIKVGIYVLDLDSDPIPGPALTYCTCHIINSMLRLKEFRMQISVLVLCLPWLALQSSSTSARSRNALLAMKCLGLELKIIVVAWWSASLFVFFISGKKGFHSLPLVPNLFDPWLKGPSVPVHLKMWARGH
jgi:hypothetical protein